MSRIRPSRVVCLVIVWLFMALTRRLDGSGARTREVGGKASGLDQLVAHEFSVPAAIAITTDAYRAFVDYSGLGSHLAELGSRELPPPDKIGSEAAETDEVFLAAAMNPELEAHVRDAVEQLLAVGPIAVRSSATAEDLASSSFAGQHRTFLEVTSVVDAFEAVRLCWASLWNPSVRAYRVHEGIPDDDLAMAIVIQVMVPATYAGVVFTRDPLGDPDTSRIELVEGLGEALVSGRVTPEDYRVDRETLVVRGGREHDAPEYLEDLVRLCLRIERRLGAPQDVEWAYDGSRLFVLQARQITTHGVRYPDDDGFDTPPEPGHMYTPYGLSEMLPGVLPPLLWTINAPMLDNAFRRLFADLDIEVPEVSGTYLTLGRFRGRAALNLRVLREAAAAMPAGSAAEVERQYLGKVVSTEDAEESQGRVGLRQALAGLKALRVRKRIEDEVALFADATDFVLALGVDLSSLPVQRLLAYRSQIRNLAWRGYEAEVAASAGAAAAYRGLEMALERWVGDEESALWAQKLTAGPPPEEQAGTNCAGELWTLYLEDVRNQPSLEYLLDGPVETTAQRLEALGEDGLSFVDAVRRTTRHFGSMAVYGGTAWDEDPAVVWECIVSMARSDVDGYPVAPGPRLAATRQTREEAFAELMGTFKRSWKWRLTRIITGQVVDMRRRLLAKLATDATQFISLREKAKAALLILGGEERRLTIEAARRLVASGLLMDAEDVLMLADGELTEMLLGREPVMAEELRRRKEAHETAQAEDGLPETFEGRPGTESLAPIEGDEFKGWAASQGVARGPARVLHSIADGVKLEPGDVLVARSTDPSWTPLFLLAGAIVLEEGGPLSHAAIVAREFGLPAVLNVKGATKALQDGELVEVDGTAGVVTRVGTVGAAA